MKQTVTVIPGDGIGPEVTAAMKLCVESTGVNVEWEEINVEWGDSHGNVAGIPRYLVDSVEKNKVAIKGPITTPVGKGFRSLNVTLRQIFDLYACLRPCKSMKGVRSRFQDLNIVVVRENTEDLYAGIEFDVGQPDTKKIAAYFHDQFGITISDDASIGIKPISISNSQRIVRFAFDHAKKYGYKKVTSVHKANIMKYTDGLFGRVASDTAHLYPDIEHEERLIDNLCMQLVMRPSQFDVLVLPNLYGDIISDLCAGLVGGLGVAPGANIGTDIALFEAVHGSAPKYAGQNRANPTALILSGAMMLDHLGFHKESSALRKAVSKIIEKGQYVTYDFKENRDDPSAVTTSEMAEAIAEKTAAILSS